MKKITLSRKALVLACCVLIAAVLVFGALWVGAQDRMEPKADSAAIYASRSTAAYGADTLAAEEAAYDAGAVMAKNGLSTGSTAISAQENRKLVRTADLTIATTAFDAASERIKALLEEAGGYVENLYQYGENNARRLSLSLRVPSAKLDDFLASMEGAGRVTHRSESTVDMTASYQDNEARLKTLYAKRDRLDELLLKAEDVSDLIEIETAIADTQYQIDSYETTQRSIDRQVDMSAVSVTLVEERPADSAQADVPMGERIRAAFLASVEWTGEFLRDLVVFIVMLLPAAVPVAVAAVVVVILRKRKGK